VGAVALPLKESPRFVAALKQGESKQQRQAKGAGSAALSCVAGDQDSRRKLLPTIFTKVSPYRVAGRRGDRDAVSAPTADAVAAGGPGLGRREMLRPLQVRRDQLGGGEKRTRCLQEARPKGGEYHSARTGASVLTA